MEIPAVPSIDKNASLRVDSIILEEESLPIQEKKGKVLFGLGTILGILILTGVVVFGYLYFNVSQKTVEKTAIEQTPTVTEIPQKVDIVFEVLNASGKTGEASKIKKRLEVLGYRVEKIGNAEKKKGKIELYLNLKLMDQKDSILENLKKDFSDIVYVSNFDDDEANARITIGY